MNFIFHPGEGRCDVSLGGKAKALAALHDEDLYIPDWFVVLPKAFTASFSTVDRMTVITNDSAANVEHLLSRFNPDPRFLSELNAALEVLCPVGESVAVRSSAIDEDGREHSFAGQLESYLNVQSEDVVAKVVAVWASAFSPRVRAYRKQHHLSGVPGPPAVLIQKMIQAECAGVAFGADPVSGRRDLAVVSAVAGLGTHLVNGESDADTWRVNTQGTIVERQIARKSAPAPATTTTTNAGTDPVPLLCDAQILQLVEIVRRVGLRFGRPQDIEWALSKGQFHLLQARPITSLGFSGKLNIWDNSNIIESYCGVTSPLTFSFARRAYEGVYRQFCQVLAVPQSRIRANDETYRHMLGLIRGRVYYNLLNWYRVLALLPGFTLNRRFMEQMMGVKEELPTEIVAELSRASAADKIRDGLAVAGSLLALMANHFLLPRKIQSFYRRLNEALAPPGKPLDEQSANELCEYFLVLEGKLLTRWDAPLVNDFFAMIFYGVSRRLMTTWVGDAEGTLQNDLLCGEGGMISAEPVVQIRKLSTFASLDKDFTERLCRSSLEEILASMEDHLEFKSAYWEYLTKFGDRCLEELKLESLTLHDDPLLLLRSVGQLASSGSCAPNAPQPKPPATDSRQKAEDRVRKAFSRHPVRQVLFQWVVRHTRARVRDRENLRFERTRLFGRVRRLFLELGRRLHQEGHLHEARDIFYLEVDEVLGFIGGTATTRRLRELVALRKVEFAEYRATPAPPNRLTTYGIVNQGTVLAEVPASTPTSASGQRKGIGCCPGVVRGRVRKISDPRNAVIQFGEILVAERTDPGWILLFPSAAGLLVERGSLLSHSAIVAREMRIPAIVSIEGLTAWLNDGDLIEFDGSSGVIVKTETNV